MSFEIQIEKEVLARIILWPNEYAAVADLFDKVIFSTKHQYIYDVYKKSENKDILSLSLLLGENFGDRHKAIEYLNTLQNDFRYYVDLPKALFHLIDYTNSLKLTGDISKTLVESESKPLTEKIKSIRLLLDATEKVFDIGEIPIEENTAKLYKDVCERFDGKKTGGWFSGYDKIQEFCMGWHPGHLVVIAGNASAGKTALALNFARKASQLNEVGVSVISYEMTQKELIARLIGQEAQIEPRRILYSKLTDQEFQLFNEGLGKVDNMNLTLDKAKSSSIHVLSSRIRSMAYRGTKIFFIDYLQLIKDENQKSRNSEVGSIARELKNLAVELDICIIVLAQLNRENTKRTNPRPKLSDLRDSGEIEEAADIVIFPFRPEYFEIYESNGIDLRGLCEIIIAKGRTTGKGAAYLKFIEEFNIFENYDGGENTKTVGNFDPDQGHRVEHAKEEF